MKKNTGFTLIELLAVIVILGVIMIIAIPSVTNYITNSRKDSYVSDAQMFISAAKTQLTADATLPQTANEKIVIPISDILLDKGGEKSPFGNDWNYDNSFIVVENVGTSSDPEYVWKIALEDVKGNCIPLTHDNDLKREIVGTGCNIENPNGPTLLSKITKNALLDTVINFSEAPTEATSGVYILSSTVTDANPIYYYRGIVANNNVKFAGFCWKIVRTTETRGIKLIYNGVPSSDGSCNKTGNWSMLSTPSKFNTSNNDNAYVGYMYGTAGASTYEKAHANTNNSTVKIVIDNWYASNMTTYTSKLEDTVWCYDRSFSSTNTGTGIGTSTTYYGADERVVNSNPQPSLACVNANDRFTVSSSNGNGALTYPIGLLTADEMTLAGSGRTGYSKSSYLYNGQGWWLGSPLGYYGNVAQILTMKMDGYLGSEYVTYSRGIRPVISLKSGAVVTSGDGSIATPYVVE